MHKLTTWFRRAMASTSIERELYPPLELPVVFRNYSPSDFASLVEIHDLHAEGRFPAGSRADYVIYLNSIEQGTIVAELNGRIIGTAGLNQVGEGIFVLCYGLIHPDFQNRRIGSTLTLLRIAATAGHVPVVHAMIFAVPQSIPYYSRFGFIESGKWKGCDGKHYPSAISSYHNFVAVRISDELKKRGINIVGGFQPKVSADVRVERVQENGMEHLQFISLKDAEGDT